jgi:hypothetical protein
LARKSPNVYHNAKPIQGLPLSKFNLRRTFHAFFRGENEEKDSLTVDTRLFSVDKSLFDPAASASASDLLVSIFRLSGEALRPTTPALPLIGERNFRKATQINGVKPESIIKSSVVMANSTLVLRLANCRI